MSKFLFCAAVLKAKLIEKILKIINSIENHKKNLLENRIALKQTLSS